ncbi:outer membrane protein assembly factor BamD [Psychromonas sp. 14N.309.X.WAT.B.A12]|uniref:outer membrane protein assembly factor BamD n=1 Tax=unclassified Psychromonas TaxID=2614957 RepID=UPI0025AF9645|nr:outer membrane protein assembly factor BamD [Psychromonas sp. 14N.309.X.WAT.B.A12]MDN2662760.1 outer membrane protein assembly factor BamD [Psychromonas sp. 14N.309.X.WAT.B.A12]
MNKILRLITTSFFIAIFISGCSSKKNTKPKVADKPPVALYQDASNALESANFEKAAEILEALDSRYPFGPHSEQVQLDLIYAYYKQGDMALALANIDKFIRLNPTHKDLDYVYYMRGLTNLTVDEQFFQNLFGVDRFNRDQSYSQRAFKDFNRILKSYPDSEYAKDARQRMVYLKDRVARYEVAVAEWYIKREAYIAAINRSKIVLNNYPDTESVKDALEIMIEAYEELGLEEPKKNALAILALNYPDNKIVKRGGSLKLFDW